MRNNYCWLILPALLLLGCNSANTHMRYLSAGDTQSFDACDVVIQGHITEAYGRSNLTPAEDLLGPEPAEPKNGFMTVFTLHVDKVLKGSLGEKELSFKASDPSTLSKKDPSRGRIPIGKGDSVQLGWKQTLPGIRENILIQRLPHS